MAMKPSDALVERVSASGLKRVHMLAWRDLEDAEAGGSEVHAHEVIKRWAAAGLEVTLRTSYAQGRAASVRRNGYRAVRKAGRYLVFPRAVLSAISGRSGSFDAVVEIWNGVPFFSPVWRGRKPSIVFLHHVHAEMWRMVMPEKERLARAGELLESRLAPPFYRRTPIVTLSESSKRELVHDLGFRAEQVTAVPPGIHARFTPGGRRAEHPVVCAVGRLVPVKRYDLLIEAMARVRKDHPAVELVIAGEGYERPALEELVERLGAGSWVSMPGHLSDDGIIDLYRRSWLVASSSVREGWGMTVTEAGACGTPAVATRIAGHEDAIVEGETGLLANPRDPVDLAAKIDLVLGDEVLRKTLAEGALERSAQLSWDATALRAFEVLAAEAERRRRR